MLIVKALEAVRKQKNCRFQIPINYFFSIKKLVLKNLKFVPSNEFPELSYKDYLSYFATSKSKLSQLFDYTGKRYIPSPNIKYCLYKIEVIKKIPTYSTNFVSFTINKDIANSFHSKGINDYQTFTNGRIPIIVKKYDLPLTLGAVQTLIVASFSFVMALIYEEVIFIYSRLIYSLLFSFRPGNHR